MKYLLILMMLLVPVTAEAKIKYETVSQTDDVAKGVSYVETRFFDNKNTVDKADDETVFDNDISTWYHRKWVSPDGTRKTDAQIKSLLRANLEEKLRLNMVQWYRVKKGGDREKLHRMPPDLTGNLPDLTGMIGDTGPFFVKRDINGDGLCDEIKKIRPEKTFE